MLMKIEKDKRNYLKTKKNKKMHVRKKKLQQINLFKTNFINLKTSKGEI